MVYVVVRIFAPYIGSCKKLFRPVCGVYNLRSMVDPRDMWDDSLLL